jgi:4-azaleucine resistance transporter AzlC
MSPVNRTALSTALAFAAAVGAIGVSFGALAVAAGLSPLAACVMSVIVFAGGSQLAAIGVIGAGGSAVAAVASGLLLNSRYAGFGLAAAPKLARGRSLGYRLAAAHWLIDESAALALAQPDAARATRVFWWSGVVIFVAWNAGTAVGAVAGAALGDPAAIGLDAAFPAGLLALVAPQLGSRRARIAAGAGATIALAAALVLPPGLPVLLAVVAPALALAIPEPARAMAEAAS